MRIRKKDSAYEALANEEIKTAATVSDALAHPARIQLLRHILHENLARRPVTNKDLVKAFDYAQATISQHLSKMVIGGLLDVRKRGTSSCYFVRIGKLSAYISILKKLDPGREDGEAPSFLRSGSFKSDDLVEDPSGDLPGYYAGDITTPHDL